MSQLNPPFDFDSVDSAIEYLDINKDFDKTFIQILKYLKNYQNIKTILVEENYIDKDFSNELSNLYSKTFRYRHGLCQRIHFFKKRLKDLNELTNKLSKNQLDDEYVGFIVKRPISVGKVGRTILAPKKLPNFYYLCIMDREVHLLGRTLKVKGVPFIEQDSMVITCAQATIWMAAKYMHYAFSHARTLPYEITDKATSSFSYLGRSIPSNGLTANQMVHGLNSMGFFPVFQYKPNESDYYHKDEEIFEKEDALWKPVEYIYPYIESEVPVLIAFKNHVCVTVGHKIIEKEENPEIDLALNDLKETEKEIRKNLGDNEYRHPAIISTSIFVDAFIIHDDQQGIYKLLPIDDPYFKKLEGQYEDFIPSAIVDDKYKRYRPYTTVDDIESVILPLPDKIYFLAEDAYNLATNLIKENQKSIHTASTKGNPFAKELLSSLLIESENPVVLRTFFIKSRKYKEKVVESDINDNVKSKYLSMNMPKYIWIVEVSIYNIYLRSNLIVGEIIFDSTSNKYDYENCYLSVHLPGFLIENTLTKRKVHEIPIEGAYKVVHRDNALNC